MKNWQLTNCRDDICQFVKQFRSGFKISIVYSKSMLYLILYLLNFFFIIFFSFYCASKETPLGNSGEHCVDQLRCSIFNGKIQKYQSWLKREINQSQAGSGNEPSNDYDELFFVEWFPDRRHWTLFPSRTTARISHHRRPHAASRIWTCAEPEFRLWWIKLCSSNNHCTTYCNPQET